MGLQDWAWGVYEYLCFLIGGIIVAINEANPYTRVKRKYFQKLPTPMEMRDKALSSLDPASNTNKAAIVTGGNAGIGLETCYFLLRAGYQVIIGCRSEKLGQEAIEFLRTECAKVGISNPRVSVIPLDLASLSSVSEFATTVKARNLPVSLLINNAGVMFMANWPTKEGYEIHFGVNHLGHFKLCMELMDVLAKNGPSRIVTLTSDTYFMGNFDLSKARGERYHRWWAYCDSKLVNLLSVRGIHRRLEDAGLLDKVKIYAVHPGCVHTGITRGAHPIIGFLYSLSIVRSILNLVSPRDGASGTIYAALSSEVANQSGRYFATSYAEHLAANAMGKESQEDELLAFSEKATNTNFKQIIDTIKKSK